VRIPSVIVCLACALIAQNAAAQERGALLIATDRIQDQTFAQTVILLLHYGQEGAVGVAINRPTWVTTREVFPRFEYLHGYRDPIFHGGPLAQATVLVLTRGLPLSGDGPALIDDVYMHSDLGVLESEFDRRLHDGSVLRFFAGHASWGPGQLEDEIAAGAWRVVPASAALIFDLDSASLWSRLANGESQLSVHSAPIIEQRPEAVTRRAAAR